MNLTGTRMVAAPVERVWFALNDPDTLKASIPGCESIELDGEHSFRATVRATVGPVSARFTGTARITDIDAPRAYTIKYEGSGGAAGFVTGEARVTLAADGPAATTLTYAAKSQVGGKLAQIGSRFIDAAASKMQEEFFTRFVLAVAPAAETKPAPVAARAWWRRLWSYLFLRRQ